MNRVHLCCLLFLITPSFGFAEDSADKSEQAPEKSKAVAKPPEMITHDDSVQIAGVKVPYQVQAGKLRVKLGKESADVFHVAYLRSDIKDRSKRPVMFAFNGGPGSSAVWLHIGMLGPKILDLPGDGRDAPEPPAHLKSNPQSMLDVCDLVFIDPVSTGYSRVPDDKKADAFHGVNGDIEGVGEFIRRWVTENDRWASPKYLLGESYGGIRAAGLSDFLQSRHGMSLNGVILLSSLLDFGTLQDAPGHDLTYSLMLPTYTAVAHTHGKIKGDRDQLVKESRQFAMGAYATAMLKGSDLANEESDKLAAQLEVLTGISASIWSKNHLRIDPFLFRAELLRDQGKTIGRFDARVAWDSPDTASSYPEYDPSYALALGAFSTALKDYLGRELGCKEDEPYEIMSSKVHPWKWNSENAVVNVADRLARAMRDNPRLKVLVMSGYNDLATPPDAIAHSLRHMKLSDAARTNISTVHYEAGHMFYLNPPDLAKSRKDLLEFLKSQ